MREFTIDLLVTDMLLSLLNICTKEELEERDEGLGSSETREEHLERKRVIKSKILAVGRVSRVFALLR
jgi:serine/threonine-protein phosphatase 2B catalytic subunit